MEYDIFDQIFGKRTPEEQAETDRKNKEFALKLIEDNPPLILTFDKFAKGDYEGGHRNLYIVWRSRQALYIGISRGNIWNRWFARGGQSHILINAGGHWMADYSSPIGRAIIQNRPASMRWKIELRYIPAGVRWDLESEEARLIHELHPLFNTTYLPPLTEKELRLYRQLTKKDREERLADPVELHINYD
jgi:hypothetical protein